MPELPDLEVFKDNIFGKLTAKRLVEPRVFNAQKVNVPQSILLEGLKDKDLLSIGRVGKELVFNFSSEKIVTVHLMLNGKIDIVPSGKSIEDIKFKIFSFAFENETIVFSDFGGLCTVRYMPPTNNVPDAFGDRFTQSYFFQIARKKPRVNIKAFLTDQSVVKGIGNAYVDEILWDARVSPLSVVGKIPDDVLETLYRSIGTVLRNAVGEIKRIAPDIFSGEERSFLKVHNKKLIKTETGALVKSERIAAKITYYTDEQVAYN